jgi:hypothetical protein
MSVQKKGKKHKNTSQSMPSKIEEKASSLSTTVTSCNQGEKLSEKPGVLARLLGFSRTDTKTVKALNDLVVMVNGFGEMVRTLSDKIEMSQKEVEVLRADIKNVLSDVKIVEIHKNALDAEKKERQLDNDNWQMKEKVWKDAEDKLGKENLKLGEELQAANELLSDEKVSVYLSDAALAVFGLTREEARAGTGKNKFALLRVWCNFIDWSAGGDVGGFVRQFKKVDSELGDLQPDSEREIIRARIATEIKTTVSTNLKASLEVAWDFVGQSYDETRHYSESESGTEISVVRSALISRDGNVLERARVECR